MLHANAYLLKKRIKQQQKVVADRLKSYEQALGQELKWLDKVRRRKLGLDRYANESMQDQIAGDEEANKKRLEWTKVTNGRFQSWAQALDKLKGMRTQMQQIKTKLGM